jgi:YesN/AraC family two-component response regulator
MKMKIVTGLTFYFTIIYSIFSYSATIQQTILKYNKALSSANASEKVNIYIELSKIELASLFPGDYSDAKKAYTLAGTLQEPGLLAEASLQLASVYLADIKGKDSALIMLKAADEYYRKAGKPNSAKYYYNYAKYCFYANDEAEVIVNARKAEAISLARSDMLICGLSRVLLAKTFKARDNRKMFIQCLSQAAVCFEESEDTLQTGVPLFEISIMLKDAGLNELAEEIALKSVLISEATNDSIGLAYLYANVSGIFGDTNNMDRAYGFLQKSINIFRKLDHKYGLAYALNIEGQYYFDKKSYAKAIETYKESSSLSAGLKDWMTATFAAANAVESLIYLKKYPEAKTTLHQAEDYANKSGDNLAQTVSHLTGGLYYSAVKDYARSIEEYKNSLSFAYKIKDANFVMKNLKAIADDYFSSGDQKQAAAFYKKYIDVKDSVNVLAQNHRREELLKDYDSKSTVNNAGRDDGRLIWFWSAAALLIIAMAGTSVFIIYRKRKTAKQAENIPVDSEPAVLENKTPKLQLNEKLQKDIWDKLLFLMEEEHVYRNAALSLADLAEKLDSNTTYVSKVINDVADSNFTTFINRYRIEEACILLSDPHSAHLSIEGIANTVGFNSKSAFNGAFKRYIGKTPSEFALQGEAHA